MEAVADLARVGNYCKIDDDDIFFEKFTPGQVTPGLAQLLQLIRVSSDQLSMGVCGSDGQGPRSSSQKRHEHSPFIYFYIFPRRRWHA
ncbi:hypothetical protein WN943_017755 [Citrus x changshan-huyou]